MKIALILCLAALVIILTQLVSLLQDLKRQTRERERERNQVAAERAELLDRVMVLKGHREYANDSWQTNSYNEPLGEAEIDLTVTPSDDTLPGFEPY